MTRPDHPAHQHSDRSQSQAVALATERFGRRSQAVIDLARSRLAEVVDKHGLTTDELKGVHRDTARGPDGQPLSAPEFWEQVAMPRAARLGEAAGAVIAEEAAQVRSELARLADDLSLRQRLGAEAIPDEVVARVVTEADGLAERFGAILDTSSDANDNINSLGSWWQGRLRRKAIIHSLLPALASPFTGLGLLVARRELELVDQVPWLHSDRMLSAFEYVHSDIRRGLGQATSTFRPSVLAHLARTAGTLPSQQNQPSPTTAQTTAEQTQTITLSP